MASKKATAQTFYVRHKHGGSFVDHESKLHVHGDNIAEVVSPVGIQTTNFLRAGGLVRCTDEEIESAIDEGRVMDGTSFERNTKIVMKKTQDKQTGKTVENPVEVPIEDDEDVEDDEDDDTEDDGEDEGDGSDDAGTQDGPSLDDLLKGNDNAKPKDKPKGNGKGKDKNKQ